MGLIKEGSVSGTLPNNEAFAVHYPGYPKSTSRAIQILGGAEGILKANFILPFLVNFYYFQGLKRILFFFGFMSASLGIWFSFPLNRFVARIQTDWSSISVPRIRTRIQHLVSLAPVTICCLKYRKRSVLIAKPPKLQVSYKSVQHQE